MVVWIEERVALDNGYVPPIIHIHSSNNGARDRMESAVVAIERLVARRSEGS